LLKYGYKLMFFNLQFMIGISINILWNHHLLIM
jgi:hypothetical protein